MPASSLTNLTVYGSGFGVPQNQLSVTATRRGQQTADCEALAKLELLREKQAETLRALRQTLIANGIDSLDEQAKALCLPRSTTWFVLQSNYKCRGLNAAQVVRMLRSQRLPENVRSIIVRYVHERSIGAYGHTAVMRRKFAVRLQKLGCSSFEVLPLQACGRSNQK